MQMLMMMKVTEANIPEYDFCKGVDWVQTGCHAMPEPMTDKREGR